MISIILRLASAVFEIERQGDGKHGSGTGGRYARGESAGPALLHL